MGYDSHVRGEIRIDPPLSWDEIRDSPYVPGRAWRADRAVKLRVVEETVEVVEGTLIRRSANAIVAVTEDGYGAYDIGEHVQELVDQHGAGHNFTGRLDGEGADNGDMWRLYVRNGQAVRVEPRIVWPDEDGS